MAWRIAVDRCDAHSIYQCSRQRSHRTLVPLSYPPHAIALASIRMAALLSSSASTASSPVPEPASASLAALLSAPGPWEAQHRVALADLEGASHPVARLLLTPHRHLSHTLGPVPAVRRRAVCVARDRNAILAARAVDGADRRGQTHTAQGAHLRGTWLGLTARRSRCARATTRRARGAATSWTTRRTSSARTRAPCASCSGHEDVCTRDHRRCGFALILGNSSGALSVAHLPSPSALRPAGGAPTLHPSDLNHVITLWSVSKERDRTSGRTW